MSDEPEQARDPQQKQPPRASEAVEDGHDERSRKRAREISRRARERDRAWERRAAHNSAGPSAPPRSR